MNATAPIASAHRQHMRALARANQIRLARAQLKRRVAAGEIDVAEVIVYCPWEVQSMAVADLLISQRRALAAMLSWAERGQRVERDPMRN